MNSVNLILWISLTLLFIALFAGLEIAFISVSRLSIELKKKQGLSSGNILSKFMEEPSRFLGVCLIGVNFCMVIYGLLFSQLMRTSLWNPLQLENEYVKLFI
jgi:CBS domain containing-hemolysin-like protein